MSSEVTENNVVEENEKNYFETLYNVNVSDKTEKKNGLTYLSWAWAWAEIKKKFPDSNYTIYKRPDGVNYWTDGRTCWVETGVKVNGIEHIEHLPVMNYKNASIPLESVTSFDVIKSIQRSLTKACARHGLGLYVYAGEDLPESESEAMERELSEVIDSIEGLVLALINKYKVNKSEISNIIKSMVTVNGKPTANYKGIKDINLAKKVYDKLYTMIETTGGEE